MAPAGQFFQRFSCSQSPLRQRFSDDAVSLLPVCAPFRRVAGPSPEAASCDAAPVDAAPVDAAPVDAAPVDAATGNRVCRELPATSVMARFAVRAALWCLFAGLVNLTAFSLAASDLTTLSLHGTSHAEFFAPTEFSSPGTSSPGTHIFAVAEHGLSGNGTRPSVTLNVPFAMDFKLAGARTASWNDAPFPPAASARLSFACEVSDYWVRAWKWSSLQPVELAEDSVLKPEGSRVVPCRPAGTVMCSLISLNVCLQV